MSSCVNNDCDDDDDDDDDCSDDANEDTTRVVRTDVACFCSLVEPFCGVVVDDDDGCCRCAVVSRTACLVRGYGFDKNASRW